VTPERKRALIIAGILGGVILIGYMILKGRSGATAAGGGSSASPAVTPTDSGAGSGGASGGGSGTSADESGLLSALAGENQDLLNSLLNSGQGYASLFGGPFGAGGYLLASQPTGVTAGTPVNTSGTSFTELPVSSGFASAAQLQSAADIVASSFGYSGGPIAYSPSAPSTPLSAVSTPVPSKVGATYSTSDAGAYLAQFGGSPTVSAPAAPVTPPTYGITYGPPAGQRATSKPGQGVISVH
jgi:hypothetical protein